MKQFEAPLTISKIFEGRKEFVPEVGGQFKSETKKEVEIDGEKLSIDYREVSVEGKEREGANPVVLLPGFGSGWEGISELGFSLACEGRKVLMLSLPGYGNSSNPSEKYCNADNYENEAEVVKQLLEKIGLDKKIHLVGHSMGSEILATFSEKYPEKVASLVLLNPAGINKKENSATLLPKFIFSGAHTLAEYNVRTMFSGEEGYDKELHRYIPKTKSPFSEERLPQRMAEIKKLLSGHLLDKLSKISTPITFIAGELDTVFPPGKEDDSSSQLARVIESVADKTRLETSVMAGLRHNTTIAPDEITAANIEHYLEKAEAKNLSDEN